MFAIPTTSILKRFTLALVAGSVAGSIAMSAPAMAADMLEDGTYGETTLVEYGTGWYLRGDISIGVTGTKNESEVASPPINGVTLATTQDFDSAMQYGVGIGYNLSSVLRLDATLDRYSTLDLRSRVPVAPVIAPCFRGDRRSDDFLGGQTTSTINIDSCVSEEETSHSVTRLMANAYYDLPINFRGFQPFIGGGLGVARNEYTSQTGNITCAPNSDERCAPTDGQVADYGQIISQQGGRNNGVAYHLAAQASAGFAYKLSENLSLDTSYTYSHLFSDPLLDGSDGIEASRVPTGLHSIKLGLRYEIW